MDDIPIADRSHKGVLSLIAGLFTAFRHPDPRVITRRERELGRASLQLLESKRFERN